MKEDIKNQDVCKIYRIGRPTAGGNELEGMLHSSNFDVMIPVYKAEITHYYAEQKGYGRQGLEVAAYPIPQDENGKSYIYICDVYPNVKEGLEIYTADDDNVFFNKKTDKLEHKFLLNAKIRETFYGGLNDIIHERENYVLVKNDVRITEGQSLDYIGNMAIPCETNIDSKLEYTENIAPSTFRGVTLSDREQIEYSRGNILYLPDLYDQKGQRYNGFLNFQKTEDGKRRINFMFGEDYRKNYEPLDDSVSILRSDLCAIRILVAHELGLDVGYVDLAKNVIENRPSFSIIHTENFEHFEKASKDAAAKIRAARFDIEATKLAEDKYLKRFKTNIFIDYNAYYAKMIVNEIVHEIESKQQAKKSMFGLPIVQTKANKSKKIKI